ncbi:MAG: hypothetical protein ACLVK4_16085 [Alistipes shahii]|uniref:hypothetical protein n=1 Tax=Alistipes shahii TaxID=328814 RepID=UPI00399C7976
MSSSTASAAPCSTRATDLAVHSPLRDQFGHQPYTRATMNAASGGNPDSRWAETYTGIRKANVILRNIDLTVGLSQSKKNQYLGETSSLNKALMHLRARQALRRHPDHGRHSRPGGRSSPPVRSSRRLRGIHRPPARRGRTKPPPTKDPDNDYGRLTSRSRLRTESENPAHGRQPALQRKPDRGIERDTTATPHPDLERWKRAADAARQVIELKNPDGTKAHELFPSYQRLFFTNFGNTESIIVKCRNLTNDVEAANGPSGYQSCRACTSVTAELIDMYELKSGRLPSEDPDYDPQSLMKTATTGFTPRTLLRYRSGAAR